MFYIIIAVTLFIALAFGFCATLHVDKKIEKEPYE